ncbi:MAG: hypothetical protein LBI41_04010 [Lactobacillales bacterium]|nr:hypothetical protein [Lactobacillales bacterium]
MKKKALKIISLFFVIVAGIFLKMKYTNANTIRLLQSNGLPVTQPGQSNNICGNEWLQWNQHTSQSSK